MSKAYLNALSEEGTRQDLIAWLVRLDKENDDLRDKVKLLEKQLKSFSHDRDIFIM